MLLGGKNKGRLVCEGANGQMFLSSKCFLSLINPIWCIKLGVYGLGFKWFVKIGWNFGGSIGICCELRLPLRECKSLPWNPYILKEKNQNFQYLV
jgi:hypothetical protein